MCRVHFYGEILIVQDSIYVATFTKTTCCSETTKIIMVLSGNHKKYNTLYTKNNKDMLLLYVWIYIIPYYALAVNMSHQKPRQV
jgi:hypothetical protein